jgi:ABC-type antimicrobial peptide transport system permease subunit
MREEVHDLVTINHVDATRQAFLGLWATFVVVPLIFGIDKFAGYITGNWEAFLATWVNDVLPGSAADAVVVLGVVEILLAVTIALLPRVGGDLFAIYMVLTAFSLFAIGGGTMVVLGIAAIGAAICALAMARLSTTYRQG